MLIPFRGLIPRCHPSVFVAEGARVIGDVEIGEDSSIWFNTVVRGDIQKIRIGKGTNVQDNCTLHVIEPVPCLVGDFVTMGHGAIAHSCTIEECCLVGMGAVVLDGALVGRGSVIGAGAVVAPGTIVPAHALVLGVPGKVVKTFSPASADANREVARRYVGYAAAYRLG